VKTHRCLTVLLVAGAALLAPAFLPARAQETPAPPASVEGLLGDWALRVDAGGEYYDLTLTLALKDGALSGAVSEVNGWFSGVPLADLAWDGTTLKFTAVTPTPPDGADRSWNTEMKKADDRFSGWLALPDLGMSVPVTGARQ